MKWKLELPHSRIECIVEKDAISLEEQMRKATATGQPIDSKAVPLLYTERKDGVLPEYDHRTDRFEIARQAKDRITATRAAVAKKTAEAAMTEAAKQDAQKGNIIGEA